MRRVALALFLAGCGGAPSPETSASSGPPPVAAPVRVEVEGEAAHPTARAMLDPELLAVVEAYEAIAASEPAPPSDRSTEGHQRWNREVFMPFVNAQREGIVALERQAAPLMQRPDPSDRRLAALLVGHAWERLHAFLIAVPAPDDVAANPELLAIYRAELGNVAVPLAHRAAGAYTHCAAQTPAPETDAWRAQCAERSERLRAVAPTRVPRPSQPPSGDSFGLQGVGPSQRDGADARRDDGSRPRVLGMLRTDRAPSERSAISIAVCESDADCGEGRVCRRLGAEVDEAGQPVRACLEP